MKFFIGTIKNNIIAFQLIAFLFSTHGVTLGQQFTFIQKLTSDQRITNVLFSQAVSMNKNYILIGEPFNNTAYLYSNLTNNNWELVQKLVPSDPVFPQPFVNYGDTFGHSLFLSDSIILIGAPHKTNVNTFQGAVYIFEKGSNGIWVEIQKLTPPVSVGAKHFGVSTSIFKDYIVVGATSENGLRGAVYVYKKDNFGVWSLVQNIILPNPLSGDSFGSCVVSNENDLFIAALNSTLDISESNSLDDAGAVYIFDEDALGNLFIKQKIVASDRNIYGRFGNIALSENYAIIGAGSNRDPNDPLSRPGGAYIFKKDINSGLWVETQKLSPSDGNDSDWFGFRVAIHDNYAVVGAYNQDNDEMNNNPFSNAGAIYVYKRNSLDMWVVAQKIVAPDRANEDNFGSAVAIWDSTIVIGAPYEDEDENGQNILTDAGSAYIFEACPASLATETQIACGSYSWIDGLTYTSSTQDETFTIPNAFGCDSIITLNLTVHPIDSIIQAVVECDVYNWNSLSLTQSGSYVSKGKNQYGCDSTFTLNLTIHNATNNMEQKSACDSIIWNGTTYDNSGIHTYSTTNIYNCDSTETLNLTIYPSSQTNINFTTCEAYTWNGQTYAQSGIYTYLTKNIYECDSITTLNLTIHPTITETIQETQCDAYTWNSITYTESGSYDYQTLSVLNCDSIATLALTIHPSSQEAISYSSCDPFLWNGTTYTESGTYTFQTQNMFGCDSTTTLDLTILPNSNNTTTQTACDTYTWSGTTYDQSGTYFTTSTNVFGCDSISTLNLTIHPSQNIFTTETACSSFLWQGTAYNQSGVYTYQTQTAFGCDSTISLNLTIYPESNIDITTTACDSLIYQGQTITESGTYTFDLQSKNGCDSIINLNLTISADRNENTQSACGSYLWLVTGEAYTQSGTYQALYTNALGCDSTYHLDLTIHPEYNQETTAEACAKYLWSLNNQTYTQSGQQSVTLRTSQGCDSIITLDVTIHPEFEYRDTIITNEPYLWPINNTTYESSGIYTETFSTDVRCDSIHYLYLTISIDTDIHVPNIISPDGPNSQFTFYGSSINIIQDLSVYDRWGNQVFHRKTFPPNDITQGWDGKYQGKNLTPGVYTYSAQLVLTDGTIISKYGDVTIIR